MDKGTYHGLLTLVALVGFVAITLWAWSGKRRKDFEAAARLPLEENPRDQEDAR